jgi:very-short-patch-repair endonuclease
MAAVLACSCSDRRSGPVKRLAVLSHRSAAALWGLLQPKPGPTHVTIAGDNGQVARNGVRVHRSRTLSTTTTTLRRGIPVTTPTRTIEDLRVASAREGPHGISSDQVRRAIRQANVLGLPLGEDAVADRTRSELERRFLRLCRRYRLPTPELNVRIDSLEVDFLWRDWSLVVETDGYAYHRGRAAFEHDRERDLRLRALGYEVVRLSYRQVTENPERIATMLKSALNVR